jgi:adenine specific DNA methylase Mod
MMKKKMVDLIWNHKGESKNTTPPVEFHSFRTVNGFKESNWSNKLFWGDNLDVLRFLVTQFKNSIDLIYIDPPFFTGSNYHFKIAEDGEDVESIAYRDHWNNDLDSYLQMLYERVVLLKKLLSKKGLIFIHLDWHASHYVRIILDEVFGSNRFVNAIVWYYYNKYSAGKKALPRAHDDILVYSNSDEYELNEVRIPREKPVKQLKRVMVDGVLKNAKDKDGHVIYRIVKDKKMDDVWRIPCLQPASKEWTGFPTQKHHDLLERIIKIGSNEGDVIADFFCGTGTTLLMAEKLNRRWIGSDISKYAINLCSNRLNKLASDSGLHHSYDIYTERNTETSSIIESGFFDQEIKLKK